MSYSTKQIKIYKKFLESISSKCEDPELMRTIMEGFDMCHPLVENVVDDAKKMFEKYVSKDKLEGYAKAITKGFEVSGMDDLKEYIAKALETDSVGTEYTDAALNYLGESVMVESVTEQLKKLAKILAVSAIIAGGAQAGETSDDKSSDENTETQQEEVVENTEMSLDDLLKKTLGTKALDYLKKKNAPTLQAAEKAGEIVGKVATE